VSFLLIIDPPEITFYKSNYTVNETSNVTLVCRAKGVPQPRIIWTRSGNSEVLSCGEQFVILNTKGSDNGIYRCIARNDIDQQDSKDIILNVQSKYAVLVSFYFLGRVLKRMIQYDFTGSCALKRHTFSFTELFCCKFLC